VDTVTDETVGLISSKMMHEAMCDFHWVAPHFADKFGFDSDDFKPRPRCAYPVIIKKS